MNADYECIDDSIFCFDPRRDDERSAVHGWVAEEALEAVGVFSEEAV